LVEQRTFNPLVAGSNPARPTRTKVKGSQAAAFYFGSIQCGPLQSVQTATRIIQASLAPTVLPFPLSIARPRIHANLIPAVSASPFIGPITLDNIRYFHNDGNMKNSDVVNALAALAQDSRLNVFRLLVKQGPEGLAAGVIGQKLGLPPATLSFHLKELSHAGLLISRQESRYIIYSANFQAMNGLLAYLTENCCGGSDCLSNTSPACNPVASPRPKLTRRRA
jgi:ArsR family transcriptional regulator